MANFLKALFKAKKNEENTNQAENEIDKGSKKNFEILKYDGIRAQRMGRTDYAIKCYVSALNIQPDYEVMNYLAQLYAATEAFEQAQDIYTQMTALEPQEISAYLQLANVHFIQEDYTAMLTVLNRANEVNNAHAGVQYLFGKARKSLGQWHEAIESLTQAIALKEDFTEALIMRAEVNTELKQYAEAMTDVETVLQKQPDEELALLLRGRINEETGKHEEAERDYRELTGLNPFNDQAFLCLARIFIEQKKPAEAIEICNEAIELNPDSAALYHRRGSAKLLNGDKEAAEQDMKQALQITAQKETEGAQKPAQKEEPQGNSLGLPFN